jgi:methyl-accepting chemotaxis protein
MATYKRRTYLINKNFQIKFIIYTTIIALLTIAAFYATITLFFQESIQLGIDAGFPQGHVYFRFVEDSKADMNAYFIVVSLIVFLMILISGIFFSHKIAGPLYRMNMYLKTLAVDKITSPLKFRNKDFFQELATNYNKRIMFLRNLATHEPEKLIDAMKIKDKDKD